MKKRNLVCKIFCLFLAVMIGLAGFAGCAGRRTPSGGADDFEEEEDKDGMIEILKDNKFEKGFGAMGLTSAEGYIVKRVLDLGGGDNYDWLLAQWATRHSFEQEMEVEKDGDWVSFKNVAKEVKVLPGQGRIQLNARASQEYEVPRQSGSEPWVHLLIEQVFKGEQRVPFSEMEELVVELQFSVKKCENMMTEAEYNPGLHAAQIAWFITVENPESDEITPEGRPDYMWFGLSIFDNRSDGMEDGHAPDFGTKKLIYSIGKEKTLGEPVELGKTYTIKYDILPEVKKAFEMAQGYGFLQGAEFDKMEIGSMNLGWELPGIFDLSFEIDKISIAYKPLQG